MKPSNTSLPVLAWPVRALGVAFAAAIALTGAPARAQPGKQACAAAYERAQGLRRDGKLLAAREALITCSQPSCPAAAVADCGPWLAEVEQSLPSVVIAARDASGQERLDVRVLVDGRLVAAALDGKALPVDPGLRTFRIEPAEGPAGEQRVLIREGEKNRPITVTLGAPAAGTAAGSPALAGPAAPRAEPSVPGLVWASGAVGVAGLAVFAVAGGLALSAEADLRATCAPHCPIDEVHAVRARQVVADVGLGVGVVGLGAATWLYLTRNAPAKPPKAGATALRPFIAGAVAGIAGAF